MDCREASFVWLLGMHRQHGGDAEGTDTQGTVFSELGRVAEEVRAEWLGPGATSSHPHP